MEDIIKRALSRATGEKDIHLEVPEDLEHGDYSSNFPLKFPKYLKDPKELKRLIRDLQSDIELSSLIDRIEVAGGGFINFWVKPEVLADSLSKTPAKSKNKKIYLLEHTSPNPNKAMHLGHLRNNVFGMALGNIWEKMGINVTRDCIDNNRGIAIAKLMWGYKKYADQVKTERPDRFVDELYAKASKEFEENPEVEREVRQIVVDWENEDPETWKLWKKVLEYSYKGQEMTLRRLGSKWDHIWHEHEHYKMGKDMVADGLKRGIFKKGEGGAIVSDLAKYKLPDTVLIKSDGTALYITQDIALTKLKKEKFHPDKIFWVIGPEQSLAMRQLFAICEQLGIGKISEFVHLAYGYMSIKGAGKMSSRTGNVVYIDDLIDNVKQKSRGSEEVALGAIKYSILKVGRMQSIAFDIDESISLEGNSGPYIQYTYARCRSVLQRASISNFKFKISNLGEDELALLRQLYRFNGAVVSAGEAYSPNLLANYLYQLAGMFNTFYAKERIIGSDTRLYLTDKVGKTIKEGLNLLGISAPERM